LGVLAKGREYEKHMLVINTERACGLLYESFEAEKGDIG